MHYKFLDGYFHKRTMQAVQEESHYKNSRGAKKHLEVLDSNPTLQVKRESARELKGVNDLVENGFLVVSEEYMMAVYEEKRKGAGGRTPLESERGGGHEDEAALYRARAQAKVQSLRARRLEQQVEKLRKQELLEPNRSVEKLLREQDHREVERLSRILARVRKKNRNLRQRNRSLTHQLQSIRASRSVRLLNKLDRVRARIPGRG